MITNSEEADGFCGKLIDLDLAVRVDKKGKNEQAEAQAMTDTLEYIAVGLLEAALEEKTRRLEHTYRHDLESFLYVFLAICVRYGWEKGKEPKEYALSAWYVGINKDIAGVKRGHIDKGGFEIHVLSGFSPRFECLKDLAWTLRDILFCDGPLYTGINHPPTPLYHSMIKAFDDAIESLAWCVNTTEHVDGPLLTKDSREDSKRRTEPSRAPLVEILGNVVPEHVSISNSSRKQKHHTGKNSRKPLPDDHDGRSLLPKKQKLCQDRQYESQLPTTEEGPGMRRSKRIAEMAARKSYSSKELHRNASIGPELRRKNRATIIQKRPGF